MKFEDLLSRADDSTLQALLGQTALRLLQLVDQNLIYPSSLHKILLSLHTPTDLLLAKASRDFLLDLLRLKEAELLAVILQLSDTGPRVFEAIKKVTFRSASEKEALLTFFELPLPVPDEILAPQVLTKAAPHYPLFTHQRSAVREIERHLSQEPHRVLLHMPTGSGKTRTAMNIISEHLRRQVETVVVWLAHSEELCEQAAAEFEKAWSHLGNRETTVYRFWGAHELDAKNIRDGILVAGLSKVHARLKNSIEFISTVGSRSSLVVMDEAHQAVAPTYRLILDSLVLPHHETGLIGLSATPGRTWSDMDADQALADFFGRRKVTLQIPGYESPVDYLIAEKYLARVSYRPLFYSSGITLSKEDERYIAEQLEIPKNLLGKLAQDEQRNLRILLEIEELSKRHIRILIFAITVEQSALLASILHARGIKADSLTGQTRPNERKRIIAEFLEDSPECRILCNYGVLTAGFDAPRTSAVVIARPTLSLVLYSQMIGRAIRGLKAGGNETAEVVTVVDTQLPGFREIAEAFTNWEDVWGDI